MTISTLNKTNYLLGARCPKSLQFKLQHPEFSSKHDTKKDFSGSKEFYELSKEYYPGCVTINNEEGFAKAVFETEFAIKDGKETIANAMFRTPTNETCIVRLMHKNDDGAYDIFDIQSKQSNDGTKLQKDGIAYIYQVLKRCNVNVGNIFIMHINSIFVKNGPIDARKFFSLYECTNEVKEMQPIVETNIDKCWKVIKSTEDIIWERDFTCIQPKENTCEFSCHCFNDIPTKFDSKYK